MSSTHVVSKVNGTLTAKRWDLDLIGLREDWILLGLTEEAIRLLPHIGDLEQASSGTMILWQSFDRLAAGELSIESALGQRMDSARETPCACLSQIFEP